MITDIGQKIKKISYQKHISVPTLAQNLGFSRSGMYRLLFQPDISLYMLQRISKELDHNFFQYYYDDTNPLTKAEKIQLTKQIKDLQQENELLKVHLRLQNQTNEILAPQLKQLNQKK